MFSVEESKMRVEIPKLIGRKTFRNWNEGILRFLKTKSLDTYMNYEFHGPYIWLDTEEKNENLVTTETLDALVAQRINTGKNLFLPIHLRRELLNYEKYNHYSMDNPIGVPRDLLVLLENAELIVSGSTIFLVCSTDGYVKTNRMIRESTSKIFSLLHTTISKPIYEIIRKTNVPKEAYNLLKNKFKISDYAEQQNLRFKISELELKSLTDYIENFEVLLAEYVALDGDKYDSAIYDSFIQRIKKSKFEFYYNLYEGDCIDNIIEYFRKIASKENIATRDNENKVTINQTKAKAGYLGRCKRCNGWGHDIDICPTIYSRCSACGSDKHFRRNCPKINNRRTNRVNNIKVADETNSFNLFDEENEETVTVNVARAQENTIVSEALRQSINEIEASTKQITTPDVIFLNVIKNSTQKSQCFCKNKDQCGRILIDSGATRHVTNNMKKMLYTRTLSMSKLVITADGTKTKTNIVGDINYRTKNGQRVYF